MYYRLTHISFNVSKRYDFLKKAESTKERLAKISGLELVNIIETGDGKGVIIGLYNNVNSAQKAHEAVHHIMVELKEYFTAPPRAEEGAVIWEM